MGKTGGSFVAELNYFAYEKTLTVTIYAIRVLLSIL